MHLSVQLYNKCGETVPPKGQRQNTAEYINISESPPAGY